MTNIQFSQEAQKKAEHVLCLNKIGCPLTFEELLLVVGEMTTERTEQAFHDGSLVVGAWIHGGNRLVDLVKFARNNRRKEGIGPVLAGLKELVEALPNISSSAHEEAVSKWIIEHSSSE